MRIGAALLLALGGLVGGASATRERAQASIGQSATCGQAGLPPCPLQSFMRNHVAAPLARGDAKTIAQSLRKVATIAPADWASWSTIALEGVAAAERGDRAALRTACNQCHENWRPQY